MPDPVDLAYAVRLRPDEAIEYFKSKGYVINWNWFDVAEEVKAKSFWVSKAMRQDILQDFRDAMTEVLEEGLTEREFIKRLKPRLQAKGWWGKQTIVDEFGDEREVQLGSPQRLRTIYRTNKFSAYQCGRLQRHQARSASRPYWQYVAVMDSRTRPSPFPIPARRRGPHSRKLCRPGGDARSAAGRQAYRRNHLQTSHQRYRSGWPGVSDRSRLQFGTVRCCFRCSGRSTGRPSRGQ
jgi:uncharacterized protein with gpF-like domain